MTSSKAPTLDARIERWPIEGGFTISRGAKTEAVVVVAELRRGDRAGRGECVPYPRYGETPEATLASILGMKDAIGRGLERQALQSVMPPSAARNALDCALLDLEAKQNDKRIWDRLGRDAPQPLRYRLYHLAGLARDDGGCHRQGRAPAAAQDQARW